MASETNTTADFSDFYIFNGFLCQSTQGLQFYRLEMRDVHELALCTSVNIDIAAQMHNTDVVNECEATPSQVRHCSYKEKVEKKLNKWNFKTCVLHVH